MAKFKFVGDKYAPEETSVFGIPFVKGGNFVDVEDSAVANKLRNHPEFKEDGRGRKPEPEAEAPEVSEEAPAEPVVEAPKPKAKRKKK